MKSVSLLLPFYLLFVHHSASAQVFTTETADIEFSKSFTAGRGYTTIIEDTDSFIYELFKVTENNVYKSYIHQRDEQNRLLSKICITDILLKESQKVRKVIAYRGTLVVISTKERKVDKQKRLVVYASIINQVTFEVMQPETMVFDMPARVDGMDAFLRINYTHRDRSITIGSHITSKYDKAPVTDFIITSLDTNLNWHTPVIFTLPIALQATGGFHYSMQEIENQIFVLTTQYPPREEKVDFPQRVLYRYTSGNPVQETSIKVQNGTIHGVRFIVDNHLQPTCAGLFTPNKKDDDMWGAIQGIGMFYQSFNSNNQEKDLVPYRVFETEMDFEWVTKGYEENIIAKCKSGKSDIIQDECNNYRIHQIYFLNDGSIRYIGNVFFTGSLTSYKPVEKTEFKQINTGTTTKNVEVKTTTIESNTRQTRGIGNILVVCVDSNQMVVKKENILRDPTASTLLILKDYYVLDAGDKIHIIMATNSDNILALEKTLYPRRNRENTDVVLVSINMHGKTNYSVLARISTISQSAADRYYVDRQAQPNKNTMVLYMANMLETETRHAIVTFK